MNTSLFVYNLVEPPLVLCKTITEFQIVRVSTRDLKDNATLKTIHSFNFNDRRCLWRSIFYWESTLPELFGNRLKSMLHRSWIFFEAYLRWIAEINDLSHEYSSLPCQLIFPFLLRSSLLPLSCIRTITELIIVVFTVEYPKTKTTLRISIDIARYILVYGTSPQH
jgi:hypothetical protein